jgi:hypothetical protein
MMPFDTCSNYTWYEGGDKPMRTEGRTIAVVAWKDQKPHLERRDDPKAIGGIVRRKGSRNTQVGKQDQQGIR